MRSKEEVQKEIDEVKEEIANFQIDADDYEDKYKRFLDDLYGEIRIGNVTFAPSRVLQELDPIAFNTGLTEYVDANISLEEDERYNQLVQMSEELFEKMNEIEEHEEEKDDQE